ncbi:MAG TPA: glycoside hydrolase family 3 N-terminal domain-containing protein [Candidatus Limnocylindria bacterium]|nr:glycoside hydrolase family 3 N-terminal domain-containing protein [Candidatus Limnocylindria bacterium]
MADAAYRDPARAVDERVADLLARMTLEEKVAQLGGVWVTELVRDDRFDEARASERLRHGTGHITRIGASTGLGPRGAAELANAVQRVLLEHTRLGIPALVHEESTGGFCARGATQFPQAIGLASTWDPALLARVASTIRVQMLAVGARQTLAPVLDVARDPRWGRVEETYGEDPYLAGVLGSAYVRGLQTADLAGGVACTGKHFLAYGLSEGGMNHAPVQLGPRELREVFAEPFAAAIRDAGLASIMNAYNSIDALPCGGSGAILTDLLRGELSFDGVVVADYFAVLLLQVAHRTAADKAEAACQALAAGLDVELPALDCYAELVAAVRAGRIAEALVDRALARALALKFRLGLFEQPFVDAGAAPAVFDTPADRALAREAAARSICLLTNDGVLPLRPDLGRLAVIGPAADDPRLLQGDYHYPAHLEIVYLGVEGAGTPAAQQDASFLPEAGGAFAPGPHYVPHVTPLAGLRAAAPGVTIRHERGCDVADPDPSGIPAAVAAAREADVAIVCVGGRSGLTKACTVGEARDATDLGLTGAQQALVEAVVATGTPTVVVLIGGRVHALPWIAEHAAALVQAWLPGEEGGHALADVLFGTVPPSGRLPVSMPRAVGQVPVYYRHRAGGGRAAFHGEYADGPTTPLFPFGHGLTYTTVAYDDLRLAAGSTGDPLEVTLAVTNTGTRATDEVVQLYVRDEVASVARPDRQLVGFARVPLVPGARRRVGFSVHPSRLAFYDPAMRFVVEPGAFRVMVGASSADVRLEGTVVLTGPIREFRQGAVVPTRVTVE